MEREKQREMKRKREREHIFVCELTGRARIRGMDGGL
jgi:hypothetical protein